MMNSSVVTRRKKDRRKGAELKSDSYIDVDTEGELRTKFVKKRRKKRKKDEEPFIITNIKVGSVIATICVVIYAIYTVSSTLSSGLFRRDDGSAESVWSQYVNDEGNGYTGGVAQSVEKSKIVPNFDISEHKVNAFNVAESLMNQITQVEVDAEGNGGTEGSSSRLKIDLNNPETKAIVDVLKALEEIKQEFVELYGGENAAREIIERGIVSFSKSSISNAGESESEIRHLARRIFQAKKEKKPFQVSFSGSSAVAGYGNFLNQTFPVVLASVLVEPMKSFGVELEVRNAAVGDIASFPLGWCLDNFMGENVDVVSWDGSLLSRGDTDAAFESYLRRLINMESSPMLIIRESVYSESKRQIIQRYVDNGNLVSPVVININAAAEPFLDLHEDVIPTGFKDWLEFGAPNGSPGKVGSGRSVRLSVKQHELVGWLISMHFITAIELGAAHLLGLDDVRSNWLNIEPVRNEIILPKPQSEIQEEDMDLMFGEPMDDELGVNSTQWMMDEIHCRTTFEPIISGALEDMVLSGSSSEDLDLLLPRGPLLYNKNWIMALGSEAKQAEYSLERYNFGYRFRKKAYYGVNPSGNLTLFVPFIESQKRRKGILSKINLFKRKKKPIDSISSLVICEVNEHVGEKQCNMVESMAYMVGGLNVKAHSIEANGVSYQGKKNCIRLEVPPEAKWTTRKKLENEIQSSHADSSNSLRKSSAGDNEKGIPLQIWVKDKFVFWDDGPCSISHVIWQQRRNS